LPLYPLAFRLVPRVKGGRAALPPPVCWRTICCLQLALAHPLYLPHVLSSPPYLLPVLRCGFLRAVAADAMAF